MENERLTYPQVRVRVRKKNGVEKNEYYIYFWLDGKRYRFSNGKLIGSSNYPNKYPDKLRESQTHILAREFYNYLQNNNYEFTLIQDFSGSESKDSVTKRIRKIFKGKLAEDNYSIKYKRDLKIAFENIILVIKKNPKRKLVREELEAFFKKKYKSAGYFNSKLGDYRVVLKYMAKSGFPVCEFNLKRRVVKNRDYHAHIEDPATLLKELKAACPKLWMLCLLQYSLGLRPHEEIRRLKWSYFGDDFSYINVPGKLLKSKQNRTIPIDGWLKECLLEYTGGKIPRNNNNIFTNKYAPHNPDYFKTRWSRLKKEGLIHPAPNVTIYSWRHTAVKHIMEDKYGKGQPGDILAAQKFCGHSSIKSTQSYTKNINIKPIRLDQMPGNPMDD